jgi:hypothetical protein
VEPQNEVDGTVCETITLSRLAVEVPGSPFDFKRQDSLGRPLHTFLEMDDGSCLAFDRPAHFSTLGLGLLQHRLQGLGLDSM